MKKNFVYRTAALGMALVMGCTACGGTSSAQPETSASAAQSSVVSDTEQSFQTSSASETGSSANSATSETTSQISQTAEVNDSNFTAPEIPGLTWESTMPLTYANQFAVQYYSDGYKVLQVSDGENYLVVPEGKTAPDGLDANMQVLQQPLDHIYLAATAVMSLFDALGSVDNVILSCTQASGWYVDSAVEAMNSGKMEFAGKYSEPDYELLVQKDCDLAIESTMILHSPKVKEMIIDLGIPAFVDYSSYETHPLGRTEWIKLYGALLNKEDEANKYFDEQTAVISQLKDFQNTEKTVAFFYISTDGTVVVREKSDYVPSMIEIAGGRYIFQQQIKPDSTATSVSMTMEEFYKAAVNADYLIYNATIDQPINSVDDLIGKNELFSEFKAVKEGNVWCCGKALYQATSTVGDMITDLHTMLTGGDDSTMTFLKKIN